MNGHGNSKGAPDLRPFVSVLVPAYNEAAILQANLARLAEYMGTLADRYRWELVIVDDGSTDGTGDLARAFQASSDNTRLCQHPVNLGLGRALCSGFSACRGQYVVVIDIDLTYTPDHIGALLDAIVSTRAEIVIASPYMKGGLASDVPLFRRLLSRWGNRFLALTTRGVNRAGHLSTLTGMVRVYDGGFIRALNLKSPGTEINTEIIYKAMILGARIEEIPAHVDWGQVKESRSTRTSGRRLRRGILFGLFSGYMIRPFTFFIIPAVVLGLISLYPLFWVFYHVITYYQEVARSGRKASPAIGPWSNPAGTAQ